jgi:hypothetical protein
MTSFIEDMRIDYNRADILMTQQFLDGPYDITRFSRFREERIPDGAENTTLPACYQSGVARENVKYGTCHFPQDSCNPLDKFL